MSRIGKRILNIPEKTNVSLGNSILNVEGPLGKLSLDIPNVFKVDISENKIKIEPTSILKNVTFTNALHGTYNSLIKNLIEGVNKYFVKELKLVGVGYRVKQEGKVLVFQLGFSHLIKLEIPEDLKVELVKNNHIIIKGISKSRVGFYAAKIRDFKKPEPYSGHGIRYHDEIVRRKVGKKAGKK